MTAVDVEASSPAVDVSTAMAAVELDELHLRVGVDGYASILGPSNSGKTRLLAVLALLRRPSCGEYRFFGLPATRLDAGQRAALATRIELMPVAPTLVPHLTVLENVALGMFHDPSAAAERERRARFLLDLVGMEDRADAPAAHLSGGEGRRVAIACSLAPRPSLLLCDDPTSGLSAEDACAVLNAIDAARAERITLVTATREPVVAGRAELVVRLR